MSKQRALGLIFVILGALCFDGDITGAVIGASAGSGSIGIILALAGILLLAFESHKAVVKEIVKKYEEGEINLIEATTELDKAVGGIQNVKYITNMKHSISGKRDSYSIELKQGKRAEDLAVAEYLLAVKNNPRGIRQNSIEISKGVSTKHYAGGFRELLEKFKRKHKEELEAILAA